MQYYEKEEDEMLDKQHSPLGKHATAEKHQGPSPSHVLALYSLFTDTIP